MNTFVAGGAEGRFLGFFFSLVIGALSYGGVESVVVAAGEAENPRRNLPKAIRRVFWRLVFFYIFGSFAVGVLVPYNDPDLLQAIATGAPGAASSPWVIAIQRAGIPALPSIINAVILSSAASAANACLYNSSRFLMSMAQAGFAPKLFLRCSQRYAGKLDPPGGETDPFQRNTLLWCGVYGHFHSPDLPQLFRRTNQCLHLARQYWDPGCPVLVDDHLHHIPAVLCRSEEARSG